MAALRPAGQREGAAPQRRRFSRLEKATDQMSTTEIPVIDMSKLNAFIGQFVTHLGAAVHTGMVVIGEKLGLYKASLDKQ
jgi:hypothetical protein